MKYSTFLPLSCWTPPTPPPQDFSCLNPLRNKNLKVPIIFSHAAVGEGPTLDSFIKNTADHQNFNDPKSYFNTSTLSLNDEDIREVVKTDGIIGIVLHEGRIADKRAMKPGAYGVKKNKRLIENLEDDVQRLEEEYRRARKERRKKRLMRKINHRKHKIDVTIEHVKDAYVCMIMANIYRIVEITYKMDNSLQGKGWDYICIGSDYDGMINKLDFLGTVDEFPELKKRFIEYLKNPEPLKGFDPTWTTQKLKDLQFGNSAEELADKFFSLNAKSFLKKYFNENYLTQ